MSLFCSVLKLQPVSQETAQKKTVPGCLVLVKKGLKRKARKKTQEATWAEAHKLSFRQNRNSDL